MVSNTNTISGKAMSTLIGTICLIGPWFFNLNFASKFLISFIGIILVFLGTR